jgi:hypothetical protein
MILFVLINLFCFILLLSKFAWADKSSWNKSTYNVMSVFAPFHPQTQLLTKECDSENEACGENQCDQCDECVSEDESDENPLTESSISTPTTELENPENYSGESKQNSVSGSSSDSDESAVILEKNININYLEKTREIVQGLKDELEKKNE